MRWSWIVLLGVVAAGVYAFFGSSEGGEGGAPTTPAADRKAQAEDLGLSTEEQKRESEAVQLVSALDDPAQAADPALWGRILGEYGDTLAARRAAYKKGVELYQATPSMREKKRKTAAKAAADRASTRRAPTRTASRPIRGEAIACTASWGRFAVENWVRVSPRASIRSAARPPFT